MLEACAARCDELDDPRLPRDVPRQRGRGGSTQGRLGLAAGAAAAAVVLVVAVGLLVRGPLERMPENSLKYVVGLLLTSFGVFWGGEGAGVEWPGADLAILGILAFLSLVSYTLTRELRRRRLMLRPAAASS